MLLTNQVYHMDCLEGMKQIKDKSIDMILCDPPYGVTNCRWDMVIPVEALWKEYKRIIKDNGAIILMAVQPFVTHLIAGNLEMFRYEWIWEKPCAKGFFNAKRQPLKAHENILVFYKGQPVYHPQMQYGCKRKVSKKRLDISQKDSCYGHNTHEIIYDSTMRYPRTVQHLAIAFREGEYILLKNRWSFLNILS